MRLELSDDEAEVVEDILGMWIDGIDGEVPELEVGEEQNVVWQLFQLRQHKEKVARVRMRLQLERRDQ
jgi:hypothetical protein